MIIQKNQKHISLLLKNENEQAVINAIDTLYLIRHNSIAVDGEFGAGNQLFKEIRNLGLLDALKRKLEQLTSKRLSLEEMSKGQLLNNL